MMVMMMEIGVDATTILQCNLWAVGSKLYFWGGGREGWTEDLGVVVFVVGTGRKDCMNGTQSESW